jgi:hypothetical protein
MQDDRRRSSCSQMYLFHKSTHENLTRRILFARNIWLWIKWVAQTYLNCLEYCTHNLRTQDHRDSESCQKELGGSLRGDQEDCSIVGCTLSFGDILTSI